LRASKKGNELKSGVPPNLRQMLRIRMVKEGWASINQFKRGAGVPYSLETVRRAFNECPYKRLDAITLAVIMWHLNYSQKEIKVILTKFMPGDKTLDVIGDQEIRSLSNAEEKLLEYYHLMVKADPNRSTIMANQLDLINVDLKPQAQLRKLSATLRQ